MNNKLIGLAAGALCLTMAACGGSSSTESAADGSSAGSSQTQGEGKKLTVWIMEGTNPDSTAFFKEVQTSFKTKTGADLDVQLVPWASALDKFNTSIAGGTTPDVAEIGTTWTPGFADDGALVDLTDKIKGDGLEADLVPSLVEAGTLDGKQYGMPWYAGVRAFIYNKDVFAKAGITTPPKTWAELTDAVAKIKKSDPKAIPLPVAGGSPLSYDSFVWGAGGELASQEGDAWKSQVNSAASVEGLQYWTDLALKHQSSTAAAATWNEKDTLKAFEAGNVGMAVQGSWTLATIKQDAPDIAAKTGAFVMPTKDGNGMGKSFVGGSHLGIFENSENQDLAWEFVKLMTTGDLAKKWGQQANYFPGQKSLLEADQASADANRKIFIQQMVEGGKSVPVTPAWTKVEAQKTIPTMVQSVLTGKADAKTAADAAAKEMDSLFQE